MAFLIVMRGGEELNRFELLGPVTLGRSSAVCDLVSRDPLVSRRHCRIEPVDAGWSITDLESRNGTRVGGRLVRESLLLQPGDEIILGHTVLRFREGPLPARRPADPVEALELARVGQSEPAPFFEPGPRPMPRAWHQLDTRDSTGLSDTKIP